MEPAQETMSERSYVGLIMRCIMLGHSWWQHPNGQTVFCEHCGETEDAAVLFEKSRDWLWSTPFWRGPLREIAELVRGRQKFDLHEDPDERG